MSVKNQPLVVRAASSWATPESGGREGGLWVLGQGLGPVILYIAVRRECVLPGLLEILQISTPQVSFSFFAMGIRVRVSTAHQTVDQESLIAGRVKRVTRGLQ